jgi:hypothetical protein
VVDVVLVVTEVDVVVVLVVDVVVFPQLSFEPLRKQV